MYVKKYVCNYTHAYSIEEEADNILNMDDPTELITDDVIARMWDKYDTDGNGMLDRFVNMCVHVCVCMCVCVCVCVCVCEQTWVLQACNTDFKGMLDRFANVCVHVGMCVCE
jgi:hypothetical protein